MGDIRMPTNWRKPRVSDIILVAKLLYKKGRPHSLFPGNGVNLSKGRSNSNDFLCTTSHGLLRFMGP